MKQFQITIVINACDTEDIYDYLVGDELGESLKIAKVLPDNHEVIYHEDISDPDDRD